MSGCGTRTTTIGKTMRTCAVGAACALLGAVAAVAQEPAARAAMTMYAVQGAVGRDGAAGCRAPSDDSPAAPDVATPEGRSALAA
ncbi:hypothetical protein LLG88_10195, partial [bacterium]|nr:hypothetical protein [bacterium]